MDSLLLLFWSENDFYGASTCSCGGKNQVVLGKYIKNGIMCMLGIRQVSCHFYFLLKDCTIYSC